MTQRPRDLRGREAPFGAPVAFYGVRLVQQPITARIWFAFAMSVAAAAAGNCVPDWARTGWMYALSGLQAAFAAPSMSMLFAPGRRAAKLPTPLEPTSAIWSLVCATAAT